MQHRAPVYKIPQNTNTRVHAIYILNLNSFLVCKEISNEIDNIYLHLFYVLGVPETFI